MNNLPPSSLPPTPAAPPYLPPATPAPGPGSQPLGQDPQDREGIPSLAAGIEAILRQPRRVMYQLRQPGAAGLAMKMVLAAVLFCALYGLVVGTFSMGTQLWAAPVKVASGLLAAGLICLPSLYIFACLAGAQVRLTEISGLVAGMLLLMTLLLIGFAPVAWLFSQSTESLAWMGALHLVFWLIATVFGLRFLHAGFAHAQARSQAGLRTWMLLFVLVALQMTTALRPIVGTAETFLPQEKKFFLSHWSECLGFKAGASPGEAR